MKKVLTILMVLALVAGFAFAVDSTVNYGDQRLTVTSTVGEIVPQFTLKGSLTSYDAGLQAADVVESAHGSLDGKEMASDKSIAEENIQLYCIIYQSSAKVTKTGAAADAARYDKPVYFTIQIGNLVRQLEEGDTTQASVPGHIVTGSATPAAPASATNMRENQAINNSVNSILNTYANNKFTATYSGRVENDQEIGRFTAEWYKDTTLPDGTYKADVTVSISAT